MTFPVGVTLRPAPIAIVDDELHEEDVESFSLSLSTSDPNVGLGPDSAVEINDNDGKLMWYSVQSKEIIYHTYIWYYISLIYIYGIIHPLVIT